MDFSKVKSIVIPEGNVTKITDTNNTRTIWPVETGILLVDGNGNFVASDTYEISTKYSDASHSTIDVSTNVILPNKGGFMKIYYNYNEDASKSYDPQGDMFILPKKESEVTISYSKLTCEYAILLYDLDGNIYTGDVYYPPDTQTYGKGRIGVTSSNSTSDPLYTSEVNDYFTNHYTLDNVPIKTLTKTINFFKSKGYKFGLSFRENGFIGWNKYKGNIFKMEFYVRNVKVEYNQKA